VLLQMAQNMLQLLGNSRKKCYKNKYERKSKRNALIIYYARSTVLDLVYFNMPLFLFLKSLQPFFVANVL
jgi:hypothetical protein